MKFDRKNNDGGKRNSGKKFQRGGKKFPPGKQGGRRGGGGGGGDVAPQGRRGAGEAAAQGRRGVEDAGQKAHHNTGDAGMKARRGDGDEGQKIRRSAGDEGQQVRRGSDDASPKMRRESAEAGNVGKGAGAGKGGNFGKSDGFGNVGDTGEQSHLPRAPRPAVDIPEGTPVVQLRSASYGAFIYQRMIGHVDGKVRDGDMVAVTDKHGEFFGWGFYNSRSQIGLRMFSHSGKAPDEREIARRIKIAVDFRRSVLRLDETTDAYRLIHAEGDGLSGLVADRFGQYVVIELFSLAMYRRLAAIQDAIVDAGLSVRNFVARADKSVMELEGFKVSEIADNKDRQSVVITENGVQFNVRLSKGHKTGFFCDQRENRLALTALTRGKKLLDVCCYTGGFSCYAAKLGAPSAITAVDLDETALEVAVTNAKLNEAKIDFQHADAFDYLRSAAAQGRRWDVVILDPSKFVSRRDLLDIGLRKYADLNRLAASVVSPGGILLTCSCSGLVDQATFVQTVARSVRAGGRTMQIFRATGAGPDHPVMADSPEGGYLKAVWGRLE